MRFSNIRRSTTIRGSIGHACFAAALAIALTTPARAADWKPERTVELIVGAAAGGNLDIAARAMQTIWQSNKNGPNALVVNKPGGAGTIASVYLTQRKGGPHHLMTFPITVFSTHIMGHGKFTHADFSPIAMLFGQYVFVSVRADSPIKTGKDLIERLRKDPASLNIAIATAIGNSIHMGLALPMKAAGVDLKRSEEAVKKLQARALMSLRRILLTNRSTVAGPRLATRAA